MADKTELNLARIRACDEEIWRTIRGAKVLIDAGTGEIKGGAGGKLNGQKFKPSFGRSLKTGKKVLLPSIHTKFSHHKGSKAELLQRLKKSVEPPKTKSKDEVWQAYQKVESAKSAIWSAKTNEELEQALQNYNDAVQEYLPIYGQLDKSTLTANAGYWDDPASYELGKENHEKGIKEYGTSAYEYHKKQIQKKAATEKAKAAWKKVVKYKTAMGAAKTKDGKLKNQQKLQEAFDEYKAAKQEAPAGWKIDFKPKESSVEALLKKTPQDFMLEALEKKLAQTENNLKKGLTNQNSNANMSTTQALNQLASAAKPAPYSANATDFPNKGTAGFKKTPIMGDPDKAHKKLLGKCKTVWKTLDQSTRDALVHYTGGGFKAVNNALRDTKHGAALENAPLSAVQEINEITEAIEKSSYNFDIQVQRGTGFHGAADFLDIDVETLKNASEEELQKLLIGTAPTELGFCSTGVAEDKGFDFKPVMMNILCPAGTKMMYMEPFSYFGHGTKSASWDGKSDPVKYHPGDEQEALLQQGTRFVVQGVRRHHGVVYLDLQVVSQDPQ